MISRNHAAATVCVFNVFIERGHLVDKMSKLDFLLFSLGRSVWRRVLLGDVREERRRKFTADSIVYPTKSPVEERNCVLLSPTDHYLKNHEPDLRVQCPNTKQVLEGP